MAVVNATIRAQNCNLLREVNVFLELSIGSVNAEDTNMSPATTVLELAIFKLFLEFYEADAMWHFLLNGLSILVDQKFIELSKLTHMVQLIIVEFAKLDSLENMSKSMKLYRLLLLPSMERDEFSDEELVGHRDFFRLIQYATYVCDKDKTSLSSRECCITSLELIKKKLKQRQSPSPEDIQAFDIGTDGSILNLGLYYIRFPGRRAAVEAMIIREAENLKWTSLDVSLRS